MASRTILITGGNGGIGLASARAFLEGPSGSTVWLGVHRKRDQAEALAVEFPGRCRLVALEATDPPVWRSAVESILGEHRRLDILVNAAGHHEDALLGMMPVESWHRVMAANLHATFHGCQAVLPAMIAQRWGRIVNIASLSALAAPPGQANYAAAKAGVVALTRALAKEVARLAITVNAICPGYIQTEALASLTDAERDAAAERVPMRRLGRPEEVAAAVRFLAADEASYITGSILKVDGGIF